MESKGRVQPKRYGSLEFSTTEKTGGAFKPLTGTKSKPQLNRSDAWGCLGTTDSDESGEGSEEWGSEEEKLFREEVMNWLDKEKDAMLEVIREVITKRLTTSNIMDEVD